MNPYRYYKELTVKQRTEYAERAGTTIKYLSTKVFRINGPERQLRSKLVIQLADASEGEVSLAESIDYFLVQPTIKVAEEMGMSCDDFELTISRPALSDKTGAGKGGFPMKKLDGDQQVSLST